MLPLGHISGGFLAASGLLSIARPGFGSQELSQLAMWGAFFGFAPDLDTFFAFFRTKSWVADPEKADHRKYFSHAPLLWLAAAIVFSSVFWGNPYLRWLGFVALSGSWSHFILDSLEYGIPWAWPFSGKLYAARNAGVKFPNPERKFVRHWWMFLKSYSRRLSFYLEILIIVVCFAVIIFNP